MQENINRINIMGLSEVQSRIKGLDARGLRVVIFLTNYTHVHDGIAYVPLFRVLDALIQDGKLYSEGG